MTKDTAVWEGQSGRRYEYEIHILNETWRESPGNYIFTRRNGAGWEPAYIGETEDLSDRLPGHEQRDCAISHGATHIHAHANNRGQTARRAEEQDLILKHRPPCNQRR